MKNERKLATIRKMVDIQKHPNADNLEIGFVDGWTSIITKGKHYIGEIVVYFEVDSFLPIKPEFEFLRSCCYRKNEFMGEGFLLRTIRLRQQLSQGLILSFDDVFKNNEYSKNDDTLLGLDVTNELGIRIWEIPLPIEIRGIMQGKFPSFIQKTNQERIQNIWNQISTDFKYMDWDVTEKMEGTSSTFAYNNGKIHICSHNYEFKLEKENVFSSIAKKQNIINALKAYNKNIALQGELCGSNIQGNYYKFNTPRLFIFDIWLIDEQRYATHIEKNNIIEQLHILGANIEQVPYFGLRKLPDTLDELLKSAEIDSVFSTKNKKINAEGLVFKSSILINGNIVSFKVKSNKYLLKNKD